MTRAVSRVARRAWHPTFLALAVIISSGCTVGTPQNPNFLVSVAAANEDLDLMAEDPVVAERPLLIAGGYFDPGFATATVAREMRAVLVEGAPIQTVNFTRARNFDACRERMLDVVEASFPSEEGVPPEIDVIGVSMGGLIARYAAIPDEHGRYLRIRRLFTFGTPHHGANLAKLPTADRRVKDMRAGSDFLTRLAEAPRDYEVIPYVRLGDTIVGAENASLDGPPWWVPGLPLQGSHISIYRDPRLLADVARRLRREPSWTLEPPTPLPGAGTPRGTDAR